MDDIFTPITITAPDGKTYEAHSKEDLFHVSRSLGDQGFSADKLKFSKQTLPAETTWKDRAIAGTVGAATGFAGGLIAGGAGSIPGAVIGGAMGAMMPPKTDGEAVASLAGGLGGPLLGKLPGIIPAGMKYAGAAKTALSGVLGLGETEAAHAIQTGVDTGNPEGFNPVSPQGAIAAGIPVLSQAIKGAVGRTKSAANARLRTGIPGLEDALTHENLVSQTQGKIPSAVSDFAASKAMSATGTVGKVKTTLQSNVQNQIDGFEKTRQGIQDQIDAIKSDSGAGVFAGTKNGIKLGQLQTQLSNMDSEITGHKVDLAVAENAALANKLALEKANKGIGGKVSGNMQDQADLSTEIEKNKKVKEVWKQQFLIQQADLLNDNTLNPKQRSDALSKLKNTYSQVYNKFDQTISDLNINTTWLKKDLLGIKAQPRAAAANLATNAKFQSNKDLEISKLTAAKSPVKAEIAGLTAEQKVYGADMQKQLGVDLDGIDSTIKTFRDSISDKSSFLPRNVKTLFDASDRPDDFVKAARGMNLQDLTDTMKFIPPEHHVSFKKSLGDAVIYDFLANSYDRNSRTFAGLQKTIETQGIPNMEFFTGQPEAQKRFVDLVTAVSKFPPEKVETGIVGAMVKHKMLIGAATMGASVFFHLTPWQSANSSLSVLSGGGAMLAIPVIHLISRGLSNPKLADNLKKFVDSNGTIPFQSLPYLARFIKTEGRKTTKAEAENSAQVFENAIPPEPPQMPQMPQGQAPQQAPPQQQMGQGQPQGQPQPIPPEQQTPTLPQGPALPAPNSPAPAQQPQ